MRCLVLGGSGFLGRHLCRWLVQQGYEVRAFGSAAGFGNSKLPDNVDLCAGDFLNEDDVQRALVNCDIVFHLISTTIPETSNKNLVYDVESNVIGTIKLLTSLKGKKVKKIIFISSGGTVYGVPQYVPIDEKHPTSPICSYGITKLAIEKYLHYFNSLNGLDYCVLRVSNVFGEEQNRRMSFRHRTCCHIYPKNL